MAALSDPWNKNCGIIELHLYDDADTAARCADSMAETYAETCREDDLKQTAEHDIEELKQEIADTREHISELVDGLRQSKLATVVCEEMRRTIKRLRQDMRKAKARIEKLTDEPWILLHH